MPRGWGGGSGGAKGNEAATVRVEGGTRRNEAERRERWWNDGGAEWGTKGNGVAAQYPPGYDLLSPLPILLGFDSWRRSCAGSHLSAGLGGNPPVVVYVLISGR